MHNDPISNAIHSKKEKRLMWRGQFWTTGASEMVTRTSDHAGRYPAKHDKRHGAHAGIWRRHHSLKAAWPSIALELFLIFSLHALDSIALVS